MTDTSVDTVPAAVDNEQMKCHRVCSACFPEPVAIGTPAVCGEKVLGVKGRSCDCADCDRLWHGHTLKHRMGR